MSIDTSSAIAYGMLFTKDNVEWLNGLFHSGESAPSIFTEKARNSNTFLLNIFEILQWEIVDNYKNLRCDLSCDSMSDSITKTIVVYAKSTYVDLAMQESYYNAFAVNTLSQPNEEENWDFSRFTNMCDGTPPVAPVVWGRIS